MIQRFLTRLLLVLLPAGAAGSAAVVPYRPPVLLCRLADTRINESSGLAASAYTDNYFFTHNDSGDGPRVYAVNRRGKTLAVFTVTGAESLDWEDMARGPGPDGKPALFLADIGNNAALRRHVSVYRIPEPKVNPARAGAVAATEPAVRYDLQYEDGPHDAEALLIHPKTGHQFIVTKSLAGSSVYAAPTTLRAQGMNPLRKIGGIRFRAFPATPESRRDPIGALLATGGDISPDGERLVVRTYATAYEWPVRGGDVAGALRGAPTQIRLPAVRGGEAIAYDRRGSALLVSTEGEKAPVHELRRR
ncbi:MAG TPA: hypothetical protein VK689_17515 [Armatimonadota bacterium]|nr:hypothetical protein [Armatimonadota bacterium]